MEHTSEQARAFNDSYERVMRASAGERGEFFHEFYRRLIATNSEAASKFKSTDIEAQIRMLRASVAVLLAYFGTSEKDDYLQKLAERHSKKGVDIPPRLYSVWLDCLIETVRLFDSKFDADVETAWRLVFSKGIAFMTSRYDGV
ncbi:MAG TPA: globin [Bryobacteraceae bacterium]|nr:globin [Bryobacteraceae bacterium]